MQQFTDKKADQQTVRRLNLAATLRLLRKQGTLSRADLAKQLGLTRNSASNIVTDLLAGGLVIETEYRREGAGRPGLLLELSPKGGFAIGAEIDISRIIVVVVDFRGTILLEETVGITPSQSQESMIAAAEQLVQRALDWGRKENLKPLGIGLGLAGLVNSKNGILTYAPTLQWTDLNMRTPWEKKFSLPVLIDNEANTSALGYFNCTDQSDTKNMIYLSIGVGMAAGLILDGHLFRGTSGYAGQAGHMKIRPDGEPCRCGDRGCWVTEVALPAWLRKSGQAEVNLDDAVRLLLDNDPAMVTAVNEMGEMLGLGIVNLVNLFNLDRVVLGGAMRPLMPFMLEKAKSVVSQRALSHPRKNVIIQISARDDDAVFGAAYLILDHFMNNPTPLVRAGE